MDAVCSWYTQLFPPRPTFSEDEISSLQGKVVIITGGNSGIGLELSKVLYRKGATVYIASRSIERIEKAIEDITKTMPVPETPGSLKVLQLDLMDFASVKKAAKEFAAQEPRLDILWNHAGIGALAEFPPSTVQGVETQMGVHCVSHLLLTELLLPQLQAAAKSSPTGSVRVVWTTSWLAERAPKGGIDFDRLSEVPSKSPMNSYCSSKAGDWILAIEMARRHGVPDGIVSVAVNPGNLNTNSYEGLPTLVRKVNNATILHDPKFGAYTLLYAGLSPDVTLERNGAWIMPFGRFQERKPRPDIVDGAKPEEEGGQGIGRRFWEWCEEQFKDFVS